MRRILSLTIVFGVVLAAPVLAQNQTVPAISGTWVLNVAKSELAKGANIRSETLVASAPTARRQQTPIPPTERNTPLPRSKAARIW